MYPSYETIAAQSGNYPFIEVYQFSNAGVYQFTGADDTSRNVAIPNLPAPETGSLHARRRGVTMQPHC
jgi:hypothetical protein